MGQPLTFSEDTCPGNSSVQQGKSSDSELRCVSLKSNNSMGQPLTFSEDTCPGNSSVQQRKSSDSELRRVSLKSNNSMGQPLTFSEDTCPGNSSVQQGKSSDSELRRVSLKSNNSMGQPLTFSEDTCPGNSSVQQRKSSDSELRRVSLKSNNSMGQPLTFSEDTCPGNSSVQQGKSSDSELRRVSLKSNNSMGQPLTFSEDTCPGNSSVQQGKSSDSELRRVSLKSNNSMGQPLTFSEDTCPGNRSYLPPPVPKKPSNFDFSSVQQRKSSDSELRRVSLKSNNSMGQPLTFSEDTCPGNRSDLPPPVPKKPSRLGFYFRRDSKDTEVLESFRSDLMEKFKYLYEGTTPHQRSHSLLNEIYTELYITESESGEINNEHEVRQIETQSRRAATEYTPIKCNDIFKTLPGQDKPIRTVLTKGVAGIGKTVSVQKFIVDWAEGKENQDIQLIFPLPFRELNMQKEKCSLSGVLENFFPIIKKMKPFSGEYNIFFIFDGLDECRLSLDFQSNVRLSDVTESASVDVLLTNLIVGNLLPSSLIWITSRPAAAELIPSECVHRVTEVRGFSDPQKDEYFRKRISDQSLAERIISHLKSSRSLHIMCHIPVFCWISATVLEKMLSEAESGEIPKTLTEMYTHFLILQTIIRQEKKYEKKVKAQEMIDKLGKLAFQQLVKGNLIFYEEDLRECGIDATEALVYSGLCTQIFREEFGMYHEQVFSFVHLSIQEHLAALYAHLSFTDSSINVFDQITKQRPKKALDWFQNPAEKHVLLSYLHQKAVDEALQSKNGHLDLFLRFLLGLSVTANQDLLRNLTTLTVSSSDSNEKTVEYIKKKIRTIESPEKSINLFHCLNELGDHSLVKEMKYYLKSGAVRKTKLSSSQWSAVVFVLLTSEEQLDEFNINNFLGGNNKSEKLEVFKKLLPVIKESRSVHLSDCGITAESCATLASALSSNPSHLRELDLSDNNLGDSGVKHLSDVLQNLHCKLEILRLRNCGITEKGCAALVSALRSNPSHLRDLDLTDNKNIAGSGVKWLSDLLQNPHCKLEKLWLINCGIADESCSALASALKSIPSHLRDLNLSKNKIGNSGVILLSNGLEDTHCKLEKLWLCECGVTEKGCAALASALRSNPSYLRQLNMSGNKRGHPGVNLLYDLKKDPNCKLEGLGQY
ncbi:NACHT, LRR and PYD domains-containing protein 3-like [Megalobrama amblycephala]|uniref:NACHT, LRR and PYD domains-containing protein 3-like n=1 Tax=Megalobrama amblycephala TaxID=75352 RepID=UPI0020140981|nr:NACHT, LRR and PYD domains-containing protein 3-like [Megalobrama amblycephala]